MYDPSQIQPQSVSVNLHNVSSSAPRTKRHSDTSEHKLGDLIATATRYVGKYRRALEITEQQNRAAQHNAICAIYGLHTFLLLHPNLETKFFADLKLENDPRSKYPALRLVKYFTVCGDPSPELQTKSSYWAGAIEAGVLNKVAPESFRDFIENTKGGIHGAYKIAQSWNNVKPDRLEVAKQQYDRLRSFQFEFKSAAIDRTILTKHLVPGRYSGILEIDNAGKASLVACTDENPIHGERAFDDFLQSWDNRKRVLRNPAIRPKAKRRHPNAMTRSKSIILNPNDPALLEGTTRFPKLVRKPYPGELVLKSGEHSRKLGSHVEAKKWHSFPIFSLTLPERSTCPTSCAFLDRCYGNGMSQSTNIRYQPGPELIEAIHNQLFIFSNEAATRNGFVVRLNVLGDFPDLKYFQQWQTWLVEFPALNVFGFTAWLPNSEIGTAIRNFSDKNWDRFAIRTSDQTDLEYGSSVITSESAKTYQGPSLICPAERKVKTCCGNCGYCWSSIKPVTFIEH